MAIARGRKRNLEHFASRQIHRNAGRIRFLLAPTAQFHRLLARNDNIFVYSDPLKNIYHSSAREGIALVSPLLAAIKGVNMFFVLTLDSGLLILIPIRQFNQLLHPINAGNVGCILVPIA